MIHSFREKCDENIDSTIRLKNIDKVRQQKLACGRSEFGKHGKEPLDEVIHQISIGCDMSHAVSEESATKNIYFTLRLKNFKLSR